MRGVTIAILIAFIAFVIAIVGLGLDFFGVLEIQKSITHITNIGYSLYFSEFSLSESIEF